MLIALSTLTAFILDQIFGDPRNFPHPVVIIGKLISAMEKFTRKVFPKTNKGELAAGAFTWLVVATVSFAVPFIALVLLAKVNVWAAFALNIFWSYQIFASKSLKEQSMLVYRYLEAEDLPNSRKYLSWIVGRDTSELDPEEITKAVVETVAENTSDGVTAPMLYMIIMGAPLGMLYKAINTMDSMLGYKNDRYMYFGRIPAKIDDVANFIPARITGLLMCLTAPLIGLDGRNGYPQPAGGACHGHTLSRGRAAGGQEPDPLPQQLPRLRCGRLRVLRRLRDPARADGGDRGADYPLRR